MQRIRFDKGQGARSKLLKPVQPIYTVDTSEESVRSGAFVEEGPSTLEVQYQESMRRVEAQVCTEFPNTLFTPLDLFVRISEEWYVDGGAQRSTPSHVPSTQFESVSTARPLPTADNLEPTGVPPDRPEASADDSTSSSPTQADDDTQRTTIDNGFKRVSAMGRVSDEELRELSCRVGAAQQLRRLVVFNVPLASDARVGLMLVRGLCVAANLESLTLAFCGLTDERLGLLCAAEGRWRSTLTALVLTGNELGAHSVDLVRLLVRRTAVRHVSLRGNRLSDEPCRRAIGTLLRCPTLLSLDLGFCHLDPNTVRDVLQLLPSRTLLYAGLDGADITMGGATDLVEGLAAHNTTLLGLGLMYVPARTRSKAFQDRLRSVLHRNAWAAENRGAPIGHHASPFLGGADDRLVHRPAG